MKATKSNFSIDGTEQREGYTFGQTWNGWACPYFELETALKIAEFCSLPDEPFIIRYNADKDAFECIEGNEIEDMYEVPAQTIDTVDGLKKVYPIGAFGWVWEDISWYNHI